MSLSQLVVPVSHWERPVSRPQQQDQCPVTNAVSGRGLGQCVSILVSIATRQSALGSKLQALTVIDPSELFSALFTAVKTFVSRMSTDEGGVITGMHSCSHSNPTISSPICIAGSDSDGAARRLELEVNGQAMSVDVGEHSPDLSVPESDLHPGSAPAAITREWIEGMVYESGRKASRAWAGEG